MWNDSNVNAISFSMILEIDIANIGNVAYDVILFNTIITLLAHITSKKSWDSLCLLLIAVTTVSWENFVYNFIIHTARIPGKSNESSVVTGHQSSKACSNYVCVFPINHLIFNCQAGITAEVLSHPSHLLTFPYYYPAGHFTISELRNWEIGEFYAVRSVVRRIFEL